MGEIFRWEHPAKELSFTGERFTSESSGQIQIEHLHRYFLAREFGREKEVLDIACGEGYGAALIAQVAHSVTAIEIDANAVAHASRSYDRHNLHFIQADARAIPLAPASIDLVVSFETIEHINEQEDFIAEVRRVLRHTGVFLVSTPNRDVYSPSDSPANPFHLRELNLPDFEQVLGRHFQWVQCLLQRPMLGSAVLPAEGGIAVGPPLTFERRGDDHFEASTDLPRAVYAVAVAAAHPVNLPMASLYIETSGTDKRLGELARLTSINTGLEAESGQLKSENNRLERLHGEARSESERLELIFATARDEKQRLEALFATARSENERLEALFRTACSENERLERLFQTACSENERLEGLFRTACDENTRLEGLFGTACGENERLGELFRMACDENRRLESLFAAAQSENQRLEGLLHEARVEREQLTTSQQTVEEEMRRLSSRLHRIETSAAWRIMVRIRRLVQRRKESSI